MQQSAGCNMDAICLCGLSDALWNVQPQTCARLLRLHSRQRRRLRQDPPLLDAAVLEQRGRDGRTVLARAVTGLRHSRGRGSTAQLRLMLSVLVKGELIACQMDVAHGAAGDLMSALEVLVPLDRLGC